MLEIKLKIANLFFSKMLQLQVTCGIQDQRQEVCCAYLDHTHLETNPPTQVMSPRTTSSQRRTSSSIKSP